MLTLMWKMSQILSLKTVLEPPSTSKLAEFHLGSPGYIASCNFSRAWRAKDTSHSMKLTTPAQSEKGNTKEIHRLLWLMVLTWWTVRPAWSVRSTKISEPMNTVLGLKIDACPSTESLPATIRFARGGLLAGCGAGGGGGDGSWSTCLCMPLLLAGSAIGSKAAGSIKLSCWNSSCLAVSIRSASSSCTSWCGYSSGSLESASSVVCPAYIRIHVICSCWSHHLFSGQHTCKR